MIQRTYPYIGWVLMPSFKPMAKTFVRKYQSYGDYDGDETEHNKLYAAKDIYPTQQAALDAGWDRVRKIEDDLAKRTNSLLTKRNALMKAANQLATENP